ADPRSGSARRPSRRGGPTERAPAAPAADHQEPKEAGHPKKRRIRIAPLLLCLPLGTAVVACSDDDSDTNTSGGDAGQGSEESVKIGFITKFPVDFYDTMVDAVKAWNEDHPEVEVVFAQGESGTDDEGEITAIESMVTQGVDAI